jgi:hypothetical protein
MKTEFTKTRLFINLTGAILLLVGSAMVLQFELNAGMGVVLLGVLLKVDSLIVPDAWFEVMRSRVRKALETN